MALALHHRKCRGLRHENHGRAACGRPHRLCVSVQSAQSLLLAPRIGGVHPRANEHVFDGSGECERCGDCRGCGVLDLESCAVHNTDNGSRTGVVVGNGGGLGGVAGKRTSARSPLRWFHRCGCRDCRRRAIYTPYVHAAFIVGTDRDSCGGGCVFVCLDRDRWVSLSSGRAERCPACRRELCQRICLHAQSKPEFHYSGGRGFWLARYGFSTDAVLGVRRCCWSPRGVGIRDRFAPQRYYSGSAQPGGCASSGTHSSPERLTDGNHLAGPVRHRVVPRGGHRCGLLCGAAESVVSDGGCLRVAGVGGGCRIAVVGGAVYPTGDGAGGIPCCRLWMRRVFAHPASLRCWCWRDGGEDVAGSFVAAARWVDGAQRVVPCCECCGCHRARSVCHPRAAGGRRGLGTVGARGRPRGAGGVCDRGGGGGRRGLGTVNASGHPRVAIAYDCLFPVDTGGGERVYRRMAELFAERGGEVSYLTRDGREQPDAPFAVVGLWRGEIADREGTRHSGAALGFAWALFCHLLTHRRRYDLVVVAALPVLNVLGVRCALLGSRVVIATDWLEIWHARRWREDSGAVIGTVAWVLQWCGIRVGHIQSVNSDFTRARMIRYRPRADPLVLGLIDLVAGSVDDIRGGGGARDGGGWRRGGWVGRGEGGVRRPGALRSGSAMPVRPGSAMPVRSGRQPGRLEPGILRRCPLPPPTTGRRSCSRSDDTSPINRWRAFPVRSLVPARTSRNWWRRSLAPARTPAFSSLPPVTKG